MAQLLSMQCPRSYPGVTLVLFRDRLRIVTTKPPDMIDVAPTMQELFAGIAKAFISGGRWATPKSCRAAGSLMYVNDEVPGPM